MAEAHEAADDEVAVAAAGDRSAGHQLRSESTQKVRTRPGGGDVVRASAWLHQELRISSAVHALHSAGGHGKQVNQVSSNSIPDNESTRFVFYSDFGKP